MLKADHRSSNEERCNGGWAGHSTSPVPPCHTAQGLHRARDGLPRGLQHCAVTERDFDGRVRHRQRGHTEILPPWHACAQRFLCGAPGGKTLAFPTPARTTRSIRILKPQLPKARQAADIRKRTETDAALVSSWLGSRYPDAESAGGGDVCVACVDDSGAGSCATVPKDLLAANH